MRKLYAVVLMIIFMLSAGCGKVSKIEQKIEEPTQIIAEKPSAVPTQQSAVENTVERTQEPTDTSCPTAASPETGEKKIAV